MLRLLEGNRRRNTSTRADISTEALDHFLFAFLAELLCRMYDWGELGGDL
jgi:hypothetical protein